MKETNKNCENCKWSDTDQIGDRYCYHNKSEKRSDFVDDFDSCEYFEKDE